MTFLNKVPGWAKSQFGWLGLCLATSPVTLYGDSVALSLNLNELALLRPNEFG